ncbi:SPOSA6832_02255, partial [Sporobolomyces salmonicolor]
MLVDSLTTVFLSATSDCPTFTFYVLEIIINTTMIAEVSIRLVAFGKVCTSPTHLSLASVHPFLACQQFWHSYYNTLDLVITFFCVITLVIIFFSGCSAKGEEVFDTFLLVVRNLFQFGRLALVLRKSGKNVFTRPAPIDLSAARAYSLDLDLDDEEALSTERRAMGGDLEAQGRARREDRQFLLSDEEED